jgi:hypothetical protein
MSYQYQTVLDIPRHCEEHSDVAIHAESLKAVQDGSPRPDRSGLAMTTVIFLLTQRYFFSLNSLISSI